MEEDYFSKESSKLDRNSESPRMSCAETEKPVPVQKKRLRRRKKNKNLKITFGAAAKTSNPGNVDSNNNNILSLPLVEEETKKVENSGRSWNLASFMFPDNNLPQSWLDIMETNKNMKPFDDLHAVVNNPATENISEQAGAKTNDDDTIVASQAEQHETITIPDCPDSPDSVVFLEMIPGDKDTELAVMPELTLSVPGNVFPVEDETCKLDQEVELSVDAPNIQPYDSEIIPQSNELPELMKEIKSENKEEVQEPNPEVAIQIRIIETRRTRKLGLSVLSPTTVSAKSLKRKYGSFIHQQQHVINYRIRNQISTMQREIKKKNPDVEFLRRNMCLEETFKYRLAKFMKDNEYSIADLLKEFPALKIFSIIMDEFERVVEVTNPMVRCNPITFLEAALRKRYQRIISKFRMMATEDRLPIISTALEKLERDPQNDNLKKIVSSLCMIVNFSRDKCISSAITFKKEKEVRYESIGLPKLIMKEKNLLLEKTEIQVFLEGQEVFKVPNVYEGLLAIFAISHIFNLDYESNIEPMMRYFEYLVDIPQVLFQEEDPLPSDDEI